MLTRHVLLIHGNHGIYIDLNWKKTASSNLNRIVTSGWKFHLLTVILTTKYAIWVVLSPHLSLLHTPFTAGI